MYVLPPELNPVPAGKFTGVARAVGQHHGAAGFVAVVLLAGGGDLLGIGLLLLGQSGRDRYYPAHSMS